MTRQSAIALALALLVPASLALALSLGSVELGAARALAALGGADDPTAREILLGLRLPRALAAMCCGALLALAGCLLQVLLRNPLADPGILGVSGGASAGALGALLAGLAPAAQYGVSLAGAVLAVLAVLGFALAGRGWNPHRVILAGVAVSAGCGAAVSLMLTLAPAVQLQGLLFWLLGDLSQAEAGPLHWGALALVAVAAQAVARSLDVLTLGEDKARSLGVAVRATQLALLAGAAVATVAAVSMGGAIGSVGLVVPHLLRLAGVRGHAWLLPLSAAAGGVLLTLADTGSRWLAAPLEMPVGVATAMMGVPALLWLLSRAR